MPDANFKMEISQMITLIVGSLISSTVFLLLDLVVSTSGSFELPLGFRTHALEAALHNSFTVLLLLDPMV
jgi:hypothetical protein